MSTTVLVLNRAVSQAGAVSDVLTNTGEAVASRLLPRSANALDIYLTHGTRLRGHPFTSYSVGRRPAEKRRPPRNECLLSTKREKPQHHIERRKTYLATAPTALPPDAPFRPSHVESVPRCLSNEELEQEQAFVSSLSSVVHSFRAPVRFAFAYGSGARVQKGYGSRDKPMIDFMFGVTHPQHWHSLNLTQNADHYSGVGKFGSKMVTLLQEKIGAGVYYNPYVRVNGMEIKYGVASIDSICADLLNWDTLYIAGRMHKPVRMLRNDARVGLAQLQNLNSALRTALLYLPENFTEEELFMRIAGLSYQGDFRMRYGTENPHKVHNIVSSQLDAFRQLYTPLIHALPNVAYVEAKVLQQDGSLKARGQLVQRLPIRLLEGVRLEHGRYLLDTGQVLRRVDDEPGRSQAIAASPELRRYLDKAVYSIIHKSAFTQSLKGILTAGLAKSLRYAREKIRKGADRKGGEK